MRLAENVAHMGQIKVNALYSHINMEMCHFKNMPRRKDDIKTYRKEKGRGFVRCIHLDRGRRE
jgi:hypothetical protein